MDWVARLRSSQTLILIFEQGLDVPLVLDDIYRASIIGLY